MYLGAIPHWFDIPKRYDLLRASVSMYCAQQLFYVNGDNSDELNPHLVKHQWNLKLWVLIQKVYINSDMLLYIKFRMLSTT